MGLRMATALERFNAADDILRDVVVDIAQPYPVAIICTLPGAPRADWQLFSEWTDTVFKAFSFSGNLVDEQPAIMHAWSELDDYVDDMVAQRRQMLTEDLLSDLIRAEDECDRLHADELRMLAPASSWQASTPPEISWPPPFRCCATILISGQSCGASRSWQCARSRKVCAIPRSFAARRVPSLKMSSSRDTYSRREHSYS